MKNLVILGDSWGEPNWRGPPRPGFTAEGHTEARLKAQGFSVHNCSQSGGSNMVTWLNFERQRPPADCVIWFHTDIARDWPWNQLATQPWNVQAMLDHTADWVYARARSIYLSFDPLPKLIVIEGQSTVHQPYFHRYFNPNHHIQDWRSQLVGAALPPSQLVGPLSNADKNFFDHCRDSVEQQHQLITDVETIMTAMRNCCLFPDNCHPGDQAHQQLTEEILLLLAAER